MTIIPIINKNLIVNRFFMEKEENDKKNIQASPYFLIRKVLISRIQQPKKLMISKQICQKKFSGMNEINMYKQTKNILHLEKKSAKTTLRHQTFARPLLNKMQREL